MNSDGLRSRCGTSSRRSDQALSSAQPSATAHATPPSIEDDLQLRQLVEDALADHVQAAGSPSRSRSRRAPRGSTTASRCRGAARSRRCGSRPGARASAAARRSASTCGCRAAPRRSSAAAPARSAGRRRSRSISATAELRAARAATTIVPSRRGSRSSHSSRSQSLIARRARPRARAPRRRRSGRSAVEDPVVDVVLVEQLLAARAPRSLPGNTSSPSGHASARIPPLRARGYISFRFGDVRRPNVPRWRRQRSGSRRLISVCGITGWMSAVDERHRASRTAAGASRSRTDDIDSTSSLLDCSAPRRQASRTT